MSEDRVLGEMPAGQDVNVIAINAGCGMESRLTGLGIRKGINVKVMRNDMRGPMVLQVNNSRVMLGRGMALKIVVRAV